MNFVVLLSPTLPTPPTSQLLIKHPLLLTFSPLTFYNLFLSFLMF